MLTAEPGIIACHASEIVKLQAVDAALMVPNATLVAGIAKLEGELGLDRSNSSRLPSSDVLRKPGRTSSLQEPSSKASG
jgi:hypothetical protein